MDEDLLGMLLQSMPKETGLAPNYFAQRTLSNYLPNIWRLAPRATSMTMRKTNSWLTLLRCWTAES